jgi:hypothetical protein
MDKKRKPALDTGTVTTGIDDTMSRWTKTVIGSVVFFMIGGAVGLLAALAYERIKYLPEPDPVHFDVGSVFLAVWIVVWLAGTVATVWRSRNS